MQGKITNIEPGLIQGWVNTPTLVLAKIGNMILGKTYTIESEKEVYSFEIKFSTSIFIDLNKCYIELSNSGERIYFKQNIFSEKQLKQISEILTQNKKIISDIVETSEINPEHKNINKFKNLFLHTLLNNNEIKNLTLEDLLKFFESSLTNSEIQSLPITKEFQNFLSEVEIFFNNKNKLEIISWFLEGKSKFKFYEIGTEKYLKWYILEFLPKNKIAYKDILTKNTFLEKFYTNIAIETEQNSKSEILISWLQHIFEILAENNFYENQKLYLIPNYAYDFWFNGNGWEILKNELKIKIEHASFLNLRNKLLHKNIFKNTSLPMLIGHFENGSGLSQNAYMTKAALENLNIYPITLDADSKKINNINPKNNPYIFKSTYSKKYRSKENFQIYHINADRSNYIFYLLHEQGIRSKYNIGFFLWELDKIPEQHKPILEVLDEIWVPTKYVHDIYRPYFKNKIEIVGKGLPELNINKNLTRKDFGIPENKFVFLTAFDSRSSIARKNPIAAIKSFYDAFEDNADVCLVIKTLPSALASWADPENQIQEIKKYVEKDKRIILIDKALSNDTLYSLLNLIDCYVTTHRSEGFGYFAAYASILKKPTIYTNYSGVCDFLDESCGFPVNFKLKNVEKNSFVYVPDNAKWAEISMEHLAQRYLDVFNSSKLKDISQKAYEKITENYSVEKYTNKIETILRDCNLIAPC